MGRVRFFFSHNRFTQNYLACLNSIVNVKNLFGAPYYLQIAKILFRKFL